MKFIKKSFFVLGIFLIFLFTINTVNSANFDNSNTTENIQDIINDPNGDKEIILDGEKGEFNNLSRINVNRSNIVISGINNAKIVKNLSDNSNFLFNITAKNITIVNLTIIGYPTAIWGLMIL